LQVLVRGRQQVPAALQSPEQQERPEEALISDTEAIALVILVAETRAAAARPDTARFQLAGGLTAASIGGDNIAERAADPLDAVMTPLRDL
jgi:xanthine/CO dehydrogenase XdhC/CoxF family maturation factor